MGDMLDEKVRASSWFRELRDQIVAAFESLEDEGSGKGAPGRFETGETRRASHDGSDAGGGLMSVMRGGRIFEKVGVNVSTVYGTLGERAQAAMAARKDLPKIAEDPRFWASGISLVAHMASPMMPAVHMNTRMFWTPEAWWFGGGSDLNPAIEFDEDTAHFHGVLREACGQHGATLYPRFKAWADEYFYIAHRGRSRGVGGIFYDDYTTGDWEVDFAFTQDVGRAFLPAIMPIWTRTRRLEWSDADRETQLIHRGLYTEYNLVYDRGTRFGLETGHDANAVLMSLPPVAKWP